MTDKSSGSGYDEVVKDYSRDSMSQEPDQLQRLGLRLKDMGLSLEKHFGSAQDIEGALVGDDIYVVQSRPQV